MWYSRKRKLLSTPFRPRSTSVWPFWTVVDWLKMPMELFDMWPNCVSFRRMYRQPYVIRQLEPRNASE